MAEIFVRLLGEGVDVWRPVSADVVGGAIYRILDQAYDRELEHWEFQPGDVVRCEFRAVSDGQVLAAVGLLAMQVLRLPAT